MRPHSKCYAVENREPLSVQRSELSHYSTFWLKDGIKGEDLRDKPGQENEDSEENVGDSSVSLKLAMVSAFVSGFLFAASSYLAKRLENYPSGTLAAFLLLFFVLGGLPTSVFYWERVMKNPIDLMKSLPVCLSVHLSTYLWLLSMTRLSLFEANVIIVSYPIFAVIISRIFLKEACSVLQVAAIFMTGLGLILLTKIPWLGTIDIDSQGLGVAFSCTAAYVLAVILTRRDLRNLHFGANQFCVPLLGSPFLLLMILLVDDEPRMPTCGPETFAVIILMIIYFVGSYLLSVSLQLGEVGLVSVVRSAADVIFTFFFQSVFIGELPDFLSLVGGFFVLSSVALYGLKPTLLKIVQKSERMKKFVFLF